MHRPRHHFVAVIVMSLACALLVSGGPQAVGCNVLFGVAANPMSPEHNWTSSLRSFEAKVGRDVDVAHFYKRGQETLFPSDDEAARANQGATPLTLFYNWRPENLTWRQVADGAADSYLHQLAGSLAQALDTPFFLSLSAEMESRVNPTPGSGQTAADFRDYFRHVVTVLRATPGVQMITVVNYTGATKFATQPWFSELYPGDDVVDWIAQDPYAFNIDQTPNLGSLLNRPEGQWPGFYDWAATNYPDKPQMLAEWGVAISPHNPAPSAAFFAGAAKQLRDYPKLRALIYWNHSGVGSDGQRLGVGTTAVGSSPEVLAAFRNFVNEHTMESSERCKIPTG